MEEIIKTAIANVLATRGLEPTIFSVEHPASLDHGDWACNVALVVAKEGGETPRQFAEQLAVALANHIESVDRIEVAGPGFLNFYLTRDFLAAELMRVRALGEAWGSNTTQANEVVMVEYTSPNLFKPLHIGNLVGNIVGESIRRLFTVSGARVVRCNYPSDIGLPVAKGVWGLLTYDLDPRNIDALGEAYRKGNEAYEAKGPEKAEIIAINQALYAGTDAALVGLRTTGIATSKARMRELCTALGTEFDVEILESEASVPGTKIVTDAIGTVFELSDGAVVYRGEKVGLHTRVFINSHGLPTYETKDIGHYVLKNTATPDWTQSIIVTGNEQSEYFKVVFAAIRELFPETIKKKFEHIPTGFLTLTTGKMSSRLGNVLTGESLLEAMQDAAQERAVLTRTNDIDTLAEEIAVAALKYQILRHSVGSNIVFDKEKALSFVGDSGPYLQYTHARICSVLEKAAAAGVIPSVEVVPETPYLVEKILVRYEEVIKVALAERAPHKVASYLIEVAGAFNTFYAQEKIVDPADEFAPYKVAVSDAVRLTLKNGLWVLGIKAPTRM